MSIPQYSKCESTPFVARSNAMSPGLSLAGRESRMRSVQVKHRTSKNPPLIPPLHPTPKPFRGLRRRVCCSPNQLLTHKARPRLARKHNIASEVGPTLQDAFFFPPRSICEASARQRQARCSAQTGRRKLVCASCSTQVALCKLLCASCANCAPCKLLCASCASCSA